MSLELWRRRRFNCGVREGLGQLLEESKKIVILAVNIATDLDRRLQLQENRLRHEHIPCIDAQVLNLILCQGHLGHGE